MSENHIDHPTPKKYVQINNTAIPKYDRYPMENQYLIFINEKNIIITVKTVNFIK